MKLLRVVIALVVSVLVLSACGSDDDEGAGGAEAGGNGTTQTESSVPPPATTPPEEIQVSEPLSKAPPKGKNVIFLQCELPACARYASAWKEASQALGWNANVVGFKNSAPAAGLEQAVAQKPDYIAITGIPAAGVKAPLAKAHAANIPVISAATPEEASADGWAAQIGGTLVPDAENVGKWMANDSGDKASVVGVTIPQFPVLIGQTDWFKNEFTSLCSDCEYDELAVTIEEVGAGAIPQKLTGYLQSHPDVNYVYFTFSDLGKGIGPALERAGLRDKVKLAGCCGDAANAQEIAKGDTDAWTIAPNEYSAWVQVDSMARLETDGELSQDYLDSIYSSPSWVVDSADAVNQYLKPTNFDWPGPRGFEDQFKQLWTGST
jgi:ribose transport system substrate-binding protein